MRIVCKLGLWNPESLVRYRFAGVLACFANCKPYPKKFLQLNERSYIKYF